MSQGDLTNTEHQENYRTEYKELSSNYRLYSSWTFIVAGFTMAIQSAFFTFYGQALQSSNKPIHGNTVAVVGIITLISSLVIERRTIQLFSAMIKRGKELEFNLGLTVGQYSRLSELRIPAKGFHRFITHTWGFRLIYGTIGILWLFLFIRNYFP